MTKKHVRVSDLPACCTRCGYTYVIKAAGRIKIGKANDVKSRVASIQAMCPVPIEIIGVSRGASLERWLHRRCAGERLHGEWFKGEAWWRICVLFGQQRCAACESGVYEKLARPIGRPRDELAVPDSALPDLEPLPPPRELSVYEWVASRHVASRRR